MISPNNIEKYLKSNYHGFNKIKKIYRLKHNDKNSLNHFIQTPKKKFVFRQFLNNTPQKMEKICEVLDFCSEKNYRIMKPIIRINNKFVDSKNNYYITKFYEGKTFSGKIHEFDSLAKSLAQFHKVVKNFPLRFTLKDSPEYRIFSSSQIFKLEKILSRKKKIASKDKLVLKNFDYLKDIITQDKYNYDFFIKKGFSKQIIHGDVHPLNVIFKNSKVNAIIDFNSLRMGYVINDVAFASYRFAISNSKRNNEISNKIKRFKKIYSENNNSSIEQLDFLHEYARHEFLSRICFILRKVYFEDSNLWIIDLPKHLNSLKIIDNIQK